MFEPRIDLTENVVQVEPEAMATQGSDVYVLWRECLPPQGDPETCDLFFRRSPDQGTTFAPALELATNSFDAALVASGSSVHVAYIGDGFGNVFFRKSMDRGASFAPAVNVTNSATPGPLVNVRLATSGNAVYITWQDDSVGAGDVFLARSTNGGQSFEAPVNLSADAGPSVEPQLAAVGGSVYVVWNDFGPGQLKFRRSANQGGTFEPALTLTGTGRIAVPRIAAQGGNVYLVYSDEGTGAGDIFLSKSTDAGASFSSPVNVSNSPTLSSSPELALLGNNVHVTWEERPPVGENDVEVFYARSIDGGLSFTVPLNLSNAPGESIEPQLAVSGGWVYVTWVDDALVNAEVFLRASNDGGASFFDIVNVSSDAPDSFGGPLLAAQGDRVFVAWNGLFFRRGTGP
ncbi:MAG: sialidase family protein [Myxococcaceae bacterium]